MLFPLPDDFSPLYERNKMTTDTAIAQQKAYTDGLRDMADFLDKYPVLIGAMSSGIRSYCFVPEGEDPVGAFRGLAGLLPDPELSEDGSYFNATQAFGPHRLQVTLPIKRVAPHPLHPLKEQS